jgi:hypothetical protein
VIGRDLIYAASVSKMRKMGGSGFHMCGSGGRGFQDAGIAAYSSENAGSRVGRGSKMRPPLIECGLRMRGWGLRVRGSATGPGALGGRGAPLPPPHSELPQTEKVHHRNGKTQVLSVLRFFVPNKTTVHHIHVCFLFMAIPRLIFNP